MRAGVVAVALLAMVTTVQSAVIRVATTGNDASSGASWAKAKQTVGAAILAADAGGEVVIIAGLAGPGMRIDGFRIRNGYATFGGGIHVTASAPTIVNNDILGSQADFGGGILVWGYRTIPPVAHARIETNVIQVNRGGSGACGDGGWGARVVVVCP